MLPKQLSSIFAAPLPDGRQCTAFQFEISPAVFSLSRTLPVVVVPFPGPLVLLPDDNDVHESMSACFPSKKPMLAELRAAPARKERLSPLTVSVVEPSQVVRTVADYISAATDTGAASAAIIRDAEDLASSYAGWAAFIVIRWCPIAHDEHRHLTFSVAVEHQRQHDSLFVPAALKPLGIERTWPHEANVYSVGTLRRAGDEHSCAAPGSSNGGASRFWCSETSKAAAQATQSGLLRALSAGRLVLSGGGKTPSQAYHNARRRLATGSFNKLERPRVSWEQVRCAAHMNAAEHAASESLVGAGAAAASCAVSGSSGSSSSSSNVAVSLPPSVAALFAPGNGFVYPAHKAQRYVLPVGAATISSSALALDESDSDSDRDSDRDEGSGGGSAAKVERPSLVTRLFGWLGPAHSTAARGASSSSASAAAVPAAAPAATHADPAAVAEQRRCPLPLPLLGESAAVATASESKTPSISMTGLLGSATPAAGSHEPEHRDPRRRPAGQSIAAAAAAGASGAAPHLVAHPADAREPPRLRFAGPGRGGGGGIGAGGAGGSAKAMAVADDGNSEEEEDTNPLLKGWIVVPAPASAPTPAVAATATASAGVGVGALPPALGVADVLRQLRLLSAPSADLLIPLDLLPCPEAAHLLHTAAASASAAASAASDASSSAALPSRMAEDGGDE